MTDPPSVGELERNYHWLTEELVFPRSVEEIKVIFETKEEWKAYLVPIVAAASKRTFGLHKGKVLSLAGDPYTDSWVGRPKDIRRIYGATDDGSGGYYQGRQRRQEVITLFGNSALMGEIKYYNITLTWRHSPEST